MQRRVEEGRDMGVEELLHLNCLVPIQIKCGEEIVWTNPKPSNMIYTRPVNLQFVKEMEQVVRGTFQKFSDVAPSLIGRSVVKHIL